MLRVALLLLLTTANAWANWVAIGKSPDFTMYVDPQSLQRSGNIATAWIMGDFSKTQKKRFPPLLSMFARLGEQTGQLPLMLQRAATQLSTEVQRRAMGLATLLEPLLIVAMGLVVMLIVLAVLLPIIEMNQLVK